MNGLATRMTNSGTCNRRGVFPSAVRFGLMAALTAPFIFYSGAQEEAEMRRDESKFTLGRIFFEVPMTRGFRDPMGFAAGPPWSHDWPRAEEHLMKIMAEVTRVDVNPGGHIISFQSDECFKYPIAYMCEVGYLDLSDEEARRMAQYLLRGGFLIVDDFRDSRALNNFEYQMKKVFPGRSLEELSPTHDIWKCFYDISGLEMKPHPIYSRFYVPQYFGISDDSGRLMMVVNYNNDIAEYWEWSNDPLQPIEDSNEAYKYGINYVMYALTH
ncbi:MAG: DUF4159 domain-containing protein [Acidobacteria bacterium]|nr:DUF4159 domain-containing protein [Acidobacteriota bacterium]